jgi:hypothetical protein
MIDVEPLIETELQRMAPRTRALPDWHDVMARSVALRAAESARPATAARGRRRFSHRRRLTLIAGLVVALITVTSALAAAGVDPFGSIRSWLNGNPGKPASAAEQAGFAARNSASYVAFPPNTKIRRINQVSAGGQHFHLLGFQSGNALCLRLVRANLPAGVGRNECVTLRELRLSSAPALVASEAGFTVGNPPQNVDGIFGFADDTVRAIQYRRGHGPWQTVPVDNNTFLALAAKRAAGVQGPRLPQIIQVRALTRGGKRVVVPFISGVADYTAGLPIQPSYLKPETASASQLPGPTKPDGQLNTGTIRWLTHRESRGSAWSPPFRMARLGTYFYGRAIKPDAQGPLSVGLFLVRLGSTARIPHGRPGELILCEHPLGPFGEGGGESCYYPSSSSNSLFPAGQPFVVDSGIGGQISNFTGAVADEVASVKLFLASGRIVPAALKDNAFTVSAPADQLPGKLVAYDDRGRVVGLQVFSGPEHAVPCPALPVRAASTLPPPARYDKIDLGNLSVNGSPVLGATPADVQRILGTPDRKAGFVHHGFGRPTFFYGGKLPSAPLIVQFSGKRDDYRVASLYYQGRGLSDHRLGRVLNLQPETLQHSIAATYGSRYRLTTSYGSSPQQLGAPGAGCTGVFASRDITLSFGVEPYAGARPFLSVSKR